MKKILLLICLFVFPLVQGYDVGITENDLPYTGSKTFYLTVSDNSTHIITRIDTEEKINTTMIDNVTLGVNETEINLSVNFTVDLYFPSENETLIALWTVDNLTINLSVFVEKLIEEQKDFNITLAQGTYYLHMSTGVLPKSGSLSYMVNGLENESINLTCGHGWLSCPKTVVFGNDSKARFDIDYLVPLTAPLGVTNTSIRINTHNKELVSRIVFNITLPDFDVERYIFSPECFVDIKGTNYSAVTYECILEQEEFNIRQLSRILERERALRENATQCKPEKITEYVVAGEIDKDVYEQYGECREDRKELTERMDMYIHNATHWANKYNNFVEQYNNETENALTDVFAASVRLKQQAELEKKLMWKKFWQGLVTVIALIILGLYFGAIYNHHKKNSWQRRIK